MRLAEKQKRINDWQKVLTGLIISPSLKTSFQEKIREYQEELKKCWIKNEESQRLSSLEREIDSLFEQALLLT